jgi:hypothetical protein
MGSKARNVDGEGGLLETGSGTWLERGWGVVLMLNEQWTFLSANERSSYHPHNVFYA